MEDWKKYYEEASGYSKTAFAAFNKKRLGSNVIYNLIGLAIKNYLTALCMKFDIIPEHSSIGSMIHLLKTKVEIPDSFNAESRFINRFMNFCSLEVMETPEPSEPDLQRMLKFTNDVKILADKCLPTDIEIAFYN